LHQSLHLHPLQAASPIENRKSKIENVKASPMGFEPTISTLTGWRALQTAPRGRRGIFDSGFWIFDLLQLMRFHLPPAASPIENPKSKIENASSPGRTRTFVTWV
jgi:hypothetical protein